MGRTVSADAPRPRLLSRRPSVHSAASARQRRVSRPSRDPICFYSKESPNRVDVKKPNLSQQGDKLPPVQERGLAGKARRPSEQPRRLTVARAPRGAGRFRGHGAVLVCARRPPHGQRGGWCRRETGPSSRLRPGRPPPSPSSAGVGGVHETPRAVPAARPVTARGPSVPREQTSRHGSVRVDARRAPCCCRGFSSPFVWKDKHERLYHNKCTAIS